MSAMTQMNSQQQNKKVQKKPLDYRVMVNLPVIIKEKDLIDRKHTIEVFKRKAATNQKQSSQVKSLQSKKGPDDQIGRIYINELWSDKFHKLVLKESKIQEILERISKLHRRNVDEFVDDIHKAALAKNNVQDEIIAKHVRGYSEPIFPKISPANSVLHNVPFQSDDFVILDDQEDQSQLNSDKSFSVIKKNDFNSGKSSINLPGRKSEIFELNSTPKALKSKSYRNQKDNNLSQPKYNALSSLVSPKYYKSTQNIINQCKQINDEWELNRSVHKDKIPFYISKDDRF